MNCPLYISAFLGFIPVAFSESVLESFEQPESLRASDFFSSSKTGESAAAIDCFRTLSVLSLGLIIEFIRNSFTGCEPNSGSSIIVRIMAGF